MFSKTVFLSAAAIMLCLATMLPLATALPPPSTSIRPQPDGTNIDAELLVLDAGSLSSDGRTNTLARCQDACRKVAGCNAYVYCDRVGGCGTTCNTYVAANPKLSTTTTDYKTLTLPIKSFGAYVSGNGCENTNRFRNTMCSLKRVADINNIKTFPSEPGWKSGVIELNAPWVGNCGTRSFAMCDRCSSLWSVAPVDGNAGYAACMQCALAASPRAGNGNSLEAVTQTSGICKLCFAATTATARKTCMGCVGRHATGLYQHYCLP